MLLNELCRKNSLKGWLHPPFIRFSSLCALFCRDRLKVMSTLQLQSKNCPLRQFDGHVKWLNLVCFGCVVRTGWFWNRWCHNLLGKFWIVRSIPVRQVVKRSPHETDLIVTPDCPSRKREINWGCICSTAPGRVGSVDPTEGAWHRVKPK